MNRMYILEESSILQIVFVNMIHPLFFGIVEILHDFMYEQIFEIEIMAMYKSLRKEMLKSSIMAKQKCCKLLVVFEFDQMR